ncbi:MAG: amidohydrolase family protein [Candidatus Promineifilaceae bacterium]|nr:amidohydrolase family protein [Candidatus Promineifilaceae bacterium]
MSTLKLPGLVDVHTHLRVPGGEHKEDFASGTAAALAGGVTTVLAMPNTSPPLSTPAALAATAETARATIRCDVGLYVGASPVVLSRLADCVPHAVGLKIYLNDTFGPLRVEALPHLKHCFRVWPADKPLAMHAEGQSVAVGIGLAAAYQRPVHFCHISRRDEVELIAAAKDRGLPVTCEVTPHHLFLSQIDAQRLGPLGYMRPLLATPDDVAALWEHLGSTVDCIATDHAPHTLAEKQAADPPPGVAGLETTLPLMLTAVAEDRLTLEKLQALTSENPRRIFDLPHQADTWVEVDPVAEYVIRNATLHTKCGWTPFAGQPVRGRVERVVLRGQTVYEHGRVLAKPGSGRLLS